MTTRLLCLIGLIMTVPACADRPSADRKETTEFADLKPLIATIATADQVTLYEGLPHPFHEPKSLEAEKKTKKTVTIAGWPFYAEPLDLKEADRKKLLELLGDEQSFRPFRGEKKCGGFHPDYAVEWRVGKDTYHALICFGCGEQKVYGPESGVRVDMASEPFGKLLKPYRKNRPEAKE